MELLHIKIYLFIMNYTLYISRNKLHYGIVLNKACNKAHLVGVGYFFKLFGF